MGVNEGVKFISATKNVEQYFKAASFFCLSSRFEGFGMVLVEAQSFSLPIVSFNCDAGPSDIIDNNENGYLVETGNIKMLHNKLLQLMNLDSSQYILMSEKSKSKSEKFFILNIGNKWVEIL